MTISPEPTREGAAPGVGDALILLVARLVTDARWSREADLINAATADLNTLLAAHAEVERLKAWLGWRADQKGKRCECWIGRIVERSPHPPSSIHYTMPRAENVPWFEAALRGDAALSREPGEKR